MKYEDFEVADAATTVPAAAGVFTPGMGIALTAFLFAVIVLVIFLAKRRKGSSDLDSTDDLNFTDDSTEVNDQPPGTPVLVAALLVAAVSGGVFAVESFKPNQSSVTASQEQVNQNYVDLFASYGLETPEEAGNIRIGDLVEAQTKGSNEPTTVKIQVVDSEVVLTNINGGVRERDGES